MNEFDDDNDAATNRINITPMVDVGLTLVLVFMITMPLSIIYGITVKEHQLRKFGLTTPQQHVIVHLTTRGPYVQDEKGKEQLIPYDQFGMVLRQLIQVSVTQQVHVKIERNVPHGQTVWALDLAKQNGASDISILENR